MIEESAFNPFGGCSGLSGEVPLSSSVMVSVSGCVPFENSEAVSLNL